ncbi:hypothetical protein SAMN04488120_10548 [Fontimonas thermophila]|uniref:Uncharacterized protein n=1 Tax=Fontimonas thermophila TaxID=1076937 RepID=A0A1I2IY67_9GAMM|nr:hypothetical protein [Fontimonas thermophila]SFF47375.1 hypothetical protein SAMN04488120_10548 [Fontimonas thermophila]
MTRMIDSQPTAPPEETVARNRAMLRDWADLYRTRARRWLLLTLILAGAALCNGATGWCVFWLVLLGTPAALNRAWAWVVDRLDPADPDPRPVQARYMTPIIAAAGALLTAGALLGAAAFALTPGLGVDQPLPALYACLAALALYGVRIVRNAHVAARSLPCPVPVPLVPVPVWVPVVTPAWDDDDVMDRFRRDLEQDMITSPGYSHLPGNIHFKNIWES